MNNVMDYDSNQRGLQILRDVLPRECREAHVAGLLHIHNLDRFFEPEVKLPGLSLASRLGDRELKPLQLFRHLLRTASGAVGVCVPHFDEDAGSVLTRDFSAVREILRELFLAFHEFCPKTTLTLNIGAAQSAEGRFVAEALLDLLDEGPTLTQPFVVMRVRRGHNLAENDAHHDMLLRALDMARHRQGFAFALLDSTLNYQWLDGVAYTARGFRVEPMTGDFLRGTRDHHIVGSVSINLPMLIGEADGELERILRLAARVLAQRNELVLNRYGTTNVPGPLLINLAGLSDCYPEDPLASFALLEKLSTEITTLRREYGLEYSLAATDNKRHHSYAMEAERQHMLHGGHCLICPAGPHLSAQELYAELERAVHSGVSFLRYAIDDVRCMKCHTTVAAAGQCPLCGCLERREVVYHDGVLVGGIRGDDNPEQAAFK